jgi:hypothetical protein
MEPAPPRPYRRIVARRIAAEIVIAAPAARVWSVLIDLPAYAAWNPFIVSASGDPVIGGRLSIRARPPGEATLRFRPRVLVADPGRELRWRGRFVLPGLFDGEHSFRIEPATGGVRFVQAETFNGLLVPLTPASLFDRIRQGFEAMNRALRQRAEAAA